MAFPCFPSIALHFPVDLFKFRARNGVLKTNQPNLTQQRSFYCFLTRMTRMKKSGLFYLFDLFWAIFPIFNFF